MCASVGLGVYGGGINIKLSPVFSDVPAVRRQTNVCDIHRLFLIFEKNQKENACGGTLSLSSPLAPVMGHRYTGADPSFHQLNINMED